MRYTSPDTIDGCIPCDPNNSDYKEILRRIAEEGLVIDPYVPPPDPLPVDRRAARYRSECDPFLIATYGYQIEIDAETDPVAKGKLETKRDKAKGDYLTAKRKIREEIPD